MVGCTRQSVNKLLGQFTDDGLVRLERDAHRRHRPRRAGRDRAPLGGRRLGRAVGRPAIRSALEQDRRRGERRPGPALAPGQERQSAARRARRPGVTTAMRTAVSAAPVAGPHGQPDVGAARSPSDPSGMGHVGRGVVGPGRRTVRRDRLGDGQPRDVAEQRRDLAARSRSRRWPGASRGPRARRRWPPTRSSRRSPRRGRRGARRRPPPPARRASRRPPSSSATAETRTSTASARAYVATSGIGPTQQLLAEDLGDLRLADAGQPERPAGDVRAEAPSPGARGSDVVRPHRPHLARRAGQRDDDPCRRSGA